MKTMIKTCLVAASFIFCVVKLDAQQLINNGGFESGLAGWTIMNQTGSDGTWFAQSGTTSPVNGDPVPAPPGPTHAAMTDAQGPGSHVLYQDFVVPGSLTNATFSFQLFLGNRASAFVTPSPASLDFSTPALNQQFRADILTTSANPFSVAAGDVLLNLYQTHPGDPLVSGYTLQTSDLGAFLAAHLGQTLRLRFAEVDNVFTFQAGLDQVSLLLNAVPESGATLALLFCAIALIEILRRRLAITS